MDVWVLERSELLRREMLTIVNGRDVTCPKASVAPQERTDGEERPPRGTTTSNGGRKERYKLVEQEGKQGRAAEQRLKELYNLVGLAWQRVVGFGGVSSEAIIRYTPTHRKPGFYATSLSAIHQSP